MENLIINEVKDSGFKYVPDHPKDYISRLGGARATTPLKSPPTVFHDGHGWHKKTVRAKAEMQFNRLFDSYSCVIFTIAKAMVAHTNKVHKVKISIAEMFNAFVAGVVPGQGTSVRDGLEGFRTKGWVEDKEYPFTKNTTFEQYFSEPPKYIFTKAKDSLKMWKVNWEAIDQSGNVSHDLIKKSLKKAPVIACGYAWAYFKNFIYSSGNRQPNHLFLIDDYANEKDYDLLAYDSYPRDNQFDENSNDDEFVKKLSRNYRIWSAHRVWLTPVNINFKLLNKIKSMFIKISRHKNGGIWFIKNGEKQKIENWEALAGAIIDEIGCEKNDLTDDDLAKFADKKFFGGNTKIFNS